MKQYLEHRNDMYVREEMNAPSLRYQSVSHYAAALRRVQSVSSNISSTLSFLEGSSDNILESIETALGTLENRVQSIRDAAQVSAKIKTEIVSISADADISVVDLSSGGFDNCSYSLRDRGIILNAKNTIHLKE